jgi:hypothetical protein
MTESLNAPEVPHLSPEAAATVVSFETDPDVRRAAEVGLAIDPDGVLPEVTIVSDPSYRTARGSMVPQHSLIKQGDEVVGSCIVVTDRHAKARWFNGISVEQPGKGFGSAAYKAAITGAMREGYDFQTHEWSQTAAAAKVWERLAAAGVARVVEPFEPAGEGKLTGKYVVDSASDLSANQ